MDIQEHVKGNDLVVEKSFYRKFLPVIVVCTIVYLISIIIMYSLGDLLIVYQINLNHEVTLNRVVPESLSDTSFIITMIGLSVKAIESV